MTDLLKEVTEKGFVIIDGETNEKYHSHRQFISASRLKAMGVSPRHYQLYFEDPKQGKSTPAQELGTLVHTMLLEPDTLKDDYYITGEAKLNGTTVKGREQTERWVLECKGRPIVSQQMEAEATAMVKSALSQDSICKLLDSGKPEQSIYAVDKETGLFVKTRADFRREAGGRWNTIVDVKTAADASPDEFPKAVLNYDYILQAGMQSVIIEQATGFACEFYNYLAIENSFPYCACAYRLPSDDLELGKVRYRKFLNRVKECTDNNSWGGYETMVPDDMVSRGVITISFPSWRKI